MGASSEDLTYSSSSLVHDSLLSLHGGRLSRCSTKSRTSERGSTYCRMHQPMGVAWTFAWPRQSSAVERRKRIWFLESLHSISVYMPWRTRKLVGRHLLSFVDFLGDAKRDESELAGRFLQLCSVWSFLNRPVICGFTSREA